ncbi:MAG: hypothetical protein KKA73_08795 [Chloroflexi bacterium]|nr:hypothetical protein [Chloroflexota bacterium]MBU1747774.1 hypothetical protein [Chloroflexota bacterium]
MRCFVQTHLNAPADAVWAAVKKPQTLVHVARGFLGFSGADRFPPEWQVGMTVRTRLWFFHVLPAWWTHTLTAARVDEDQREIASREYGGFIRVWNHTIRVAPVPGGCTYSDEIEIEAGVLTVFIWLYANIFYRYRQMRWRRWAKVYEEAKK